MNLNFTPFFKKLRKFRPDPAVSIISIIFILSVIVVGFNQFSNQLASANCSTQSDINTIVSNKSSIESTLASIDSQITENNNNLVFLQESLVTNRNNINSISSQLSNYSDYYISQVKKTVDERYSTYMRAKSVSRRNKSKASLDLLDKMTASYKTTYENTLASYNDLILKRDDLKQQLVDLDNEKMVIETQITSADAKTLELATLRASTAVELFNITTMLEGAYNNMCPANEINCNDGMDDDKDGGIDCADGDCSSNSSCNGGGGGDCPGGCTNGQSCVGGICQQTDCNPTCQSGYSCNTADFTCVPDSNTCNPSCSGDQTCVNNTCVDKDSCKSDSDCGSEQTCSGGKCTNTEPTCGNGTVETGEQCDDGNDDGTDGCNACSWYCIGALPPGSSACDGSDRNHKIMWGEVSLTECEKVPVQACSYTFLCQGEMNGDFCAGWIPGGNAEHRWKQMPAPCVSDSTAYACSYIKPQCVVDSDCSDGEICVSGVCNVVKKPDTEGLCFDGVDNDGNEGTDCADPDCAGEEGNIKTFVPPHHDAENEFVIRNYDLCIKDSTIRHNLDQHQFDPAGCSDGVDNDGDGAIDGDDGDCK